MDHNTRTGYRFGILALVATVTIAALLSPGPRFFLFALILALTAGIYLGFAWLDGRPRWVLLEGIQAIALLGIALAGLILTPLLVAAGFLLHVVWDLLHHPRGVQTRIARWVPPACLLYDIGIAVAILAWWWPF